MCLVNDLITGELTQTNVISTLRYTNHHQPNLCQYCVSCYSASWLQGRDHIWQSRGGEREEKGGEAEERREAGGCCIVVPAGNAPSQYISAQSLLRSYLSGTRCPQCAAAEEWQTGCQPHTHTHRDAPEVRMNPFLLHCQVAHSMQTGYFVKTEWYIYS